MGSTSKSLKEPYAKRTMKEATQPAAEGQPRKVLSLNRTQTRRKTHPQKSASLHLERCKGRTRACLSDGGLGTVSCPSKSTSPSSEVFTPWNVHLIYFFFFLSLVPPELLCLNAKIYCYSNKLRCLRHACTFDSIKSSIVASLSLCSFDSS